MFDNTNYNERNMKDINTKHKAGKKSFIFNPE